MAAFPAAPGLPAGLAGCPECGQWPPRPGPQTSARPSMKALCRRSKPTSGLSASPLIPPSSGINFSLGWRWLVARPLLTHGAAQGGEVGSPRGQTDWRRDTLPAGEGLGPSGQPRRLFASPWGRTEALGSGGPWGARAGCTPSPCCVGGLSPRLLAGADCTWCSLAHASIPTRRNHNSCRPTRAAAPAPVLRHTQRTSQVP